jgi:hypothetical protein
MSIKPFERSSERQKNLFAPRVGGHIGAGYEYLREENREQDGNTPAALHLR